MRDSLRQVMAFVALSTVPAYAFVGYWFWHDVVLSNFPLHGPWFTSLCVLSGVWTAAVAAAIIRRELF